MAKFLPYAFSFLGGILYALGFPSALGKSLLVTPIVGLGILLFWIFKSPSLRTKILLLLSFCLSFNMVGFYWIPSTLAEFGELPYVVALLLSLGFTLFVAPHLWIFLIIIHWGLKRPQIHGWRQAYPQLFSVAIACVFTFVEYFTPNQFPSMIGQPWAAIGEYLGYANIGGIPLYSFFSFLIIMEALNAAEGKGFSKLNLAAILLFIFTNPFAKIPNPPREVKELNARMVQANISNFLKVDSEQGGYASVSEVLDRYTSLSSEPSSLGRLDLIIWPETAYPFAMQSSKTDSEHSQVPTLFQDIAFRHDSALFVGGYDSIRSDGSFYQSEYNSNFHINREGEFADVYHKHILIPFGETLPFGPLNEFLSRHIENISFFSEGEKFPLFKIHTGHSFINTICYEILKPEFVREYLNEQKSRPHALINLTNDSWYGDTAEPEQHLFLASWRALELDLPIIRSTNTGISSVIDINGKEIKRLGVGITGNLDVSLKLGKREPTVFQTFGFFALLPLWIILFIFHLMLIKLKR